MRLLSLLITLLIIAFIINKQLSVNPLNTESEAIVGSENGMPKVPTRPQDIKQFKKDMNDLMIDAAAKRDVQY